MSAAGRSARISTLVARQDGPESPLQIDVGVVADVVGHREDLTAGEVEPRGVFGRYRVGAVTSDGHAFAAQRIVPTLCPEVTGGDSVVIDVQGHRAENLELLADGTLGEIDADHMLSRCGDRATEFLLRRDANEVVDEVQLTVLHEHRVAAET